jgi:hypothetical protein
MTRSIRLTQEEYNRLCSIEYYAYRLHDFIENVAKPDWPARLDPPSEKDQRYTRALYCHLRMKELIKGYTFRTTSAPD